MDPKEQLHNAYKEIRAGNFQKAEAIYKDILKISSNLSLKISIFPVV